MQAPLLTTSHLRVAFFRAREHQRTLAGDSTTEARPATLRSRKKPSHRSELGLGFDARLGDLQRDLSGTSVHLLAYHDVSSVAAAAFVVSYSDSAVARLTEF